MNIMVFTGVTEKTMNENPRIKSNMLDYISILNTSNISYIPIFLKENKEDRICDEIDSYLREKMPFKLGNLNMCQRYTLEDFSKLAEEANKNHIETIIFVGDNKIIAKVLGDENTYKVFSLRFEVNTNITLF